MNCPTLPKYSGPTFSNIKPPPFISYPKREEPQPMCVFPLHVADVPEMDEVTCPSNHTWIEGTQQILHCMANGNPKPSVACTKDNITHNVEKEKEVNRSHRGIYNCRATNEFGSSTKTVTIQVECKCLYICVYKCSMSLYT